MYVCIKKKRFVEEMGMHTYKLCKFEWYETQSWNGWVSLYITLHRTRLLYLSCASEVVTSLLFSAILCMCNGQRNNIIVMIIIFMILWTIGTYTYTSWCWIELNCSFYLNKQNTFFVRKYAHKKTHTFERFIFKMWHLWIDFAIWLCRYVDLFFSSSFFVG